MFFSLGCVVWLPAIFGFLSQLDWVFQLGKGLWEERRGEDVYGFCCMLKEHFSISRSVTGAALTLQLQRSSDINISWWVSWYLSTTLFTLFPPLITGYGHSVDICCKPSNQRVTFPTWTVSTEISSISHDTRLHSI